MIFLQTGSGKTYTMMGELAKLGNELSKDAGLTPRIFEYLFARINEVKCLYFK
jgi:kinesin family protein 15